MSRNLPAESVAFRASNHRPSVTGDAVYSREPVSKSI